MSSSFPPDDLRKTGTDDQESPQKKLHLLLSGIWERSKKTIDERVQTLREAEASVKGRRMDLAARRRAVDAAHKLAGVLGTFGLPRGTELAREAEELLDGSGALSAADIDRFRAIVEELEKQLKTAPLSASQQNS